jgi:uncharacterized cupin superfamily protein
MSRFTLFDPANLPDPEYGAPDPANVVEGDPRFTVWTLEDRGDGRTYAGYWASTTGTWKVSYDEWEYCTLVEGRAIVSEDGGDFWDLTPGQHFVFRPGFTGTWHVIEPVIKTFVVILP